MSKYNDQFFDDQCFNDQYFIDNYFCKDNRINCRRIKHLSDKELEWLNNRYDDSFSLNETLQRIFYHIEEHPKCPTCGKYIPFCGKPNSIGMFMRHCNYSCAIKDVHYLQDQTKLKKYGSKNNYKKIQSTVLKKYNVNNVFNIDDVRKNNINAITSELAKNKRRETCLKRYGVDVASKSEIVKSKVDWVAQKDKEYRTKKKNHTFNTSKLEEETYELLKEKYPDVIRQYKSDVYPFVCDFYIPSLNLYIECNYHWTHGGHPYDSNNIDDYNKLQLWESKNSKYYRNAIITWTCRDVNKRNFARQNNLNYIEIWNINELYNICI